MPKKPQQPNPLGSYAGAGCLALFGLPFAGFGLFMGWMLVSEVWLWVEAQSWAEARATIVEVELDSINNDDGADSQRVLATYRYVYAGQEYVSERVDVHDEADNFSSYHEELFQELQQAKHAGHEVTCYVNPSDPQRALLNRSLRPMLLVLKLPFALVFGGLGFGVFFASWYVARSGRTGAKLAAKAPEEPWLWRDDWKQGVIRSSNKAGMIFVGLFALLWNLVSMPVAVVFLFFQEDNPWWAGLLVSIFPLVGLGLIVWFLRLVWRWQNYGETRLRLATLPGVIGGQLAGVVLVPSAVKPKRGFKITLTCLHSTGSGDDQRTEALWQDERRITKTLGDDEPGFLGVPVVFVIPSDARSTDDQANVEWTLKIEARVPGIDYEATFDVPVFRTEDSRKGVTLDDAPLSEYEVVESLDQLLAVEGIVSNETGAIGGVRYYTPPARNKPATIAVTLFMIVWNAVVTGMFIGGVGWMSWIFAAFGLVTIGLTLESWLRYGELKIVGEQWATRTGWVGMGGKSREFQTNQIRHIDSKEAMSNSGGKEVTQWNNLVADVEDQGEVVLIRHIRSRAAERMLLADLRRRAGLDEGDAEEESPWEGIDDAPAEG